GRRPAPASAARELEPEVETPRLAAGSPAERESMPALGPALVLPGSHRIEPGLQPLHPELVVEGTLLFVGQDLVGEGQVLEPLLGLLVPRVHIRVILAGELAVRLAYLVGRGTLREPEDGVQILLFRHRR